MTPPPIERFDSFQKVPVVLEADIECGTLSVRSLLDLRAGSIIRSDRPAGDNVDLRVGGRLVGYGEIIANENAMAVRVTNVKEIE